MIEVVKRPIFVLFALATLWVVTISIFSFVGALSWLNTPFPGFVIYKPPLVGSMGLKDWPGKRANLKMMDRIVSVDGLTVSNGQDVLDAVSDKTPGAEVHYVVRSKGKTREISLPVAKFGLSDFFLVFFVTFLGGVILFVLAVIVYMLKPHTSTSWAFFLLCFFVGGYMVTAFDVQSTYIFYRFHYVALCFMAVPLFHLMLIFPQKKSIAARFPSLEYLIYLPSLILALGWQVYLSRFSNLLEQNSLSARIFGYPFLGTIARVFLIFFVLGAIALLIHTTSHATGSLARQRARLILMGITTAFLPAVLIMMLVSFGKIYFPYNFIVFFVLAFPASIAYAIVRHNLFDADALVKHTVGYAVLTAIVIGAYAVVSITLNVFAVKYQGSQSQVSPILFTLGVILIFNPLRNRIQSVVDRVFFRKDYEPGAILEKFGLVVTSLMDLGQILKLLTQTLLEEMFINTSSVMLLNPAGSDYQVFWSDGEKRESLKNFVLKHDDPLMQIVRMEKRELTKTDVLEDPKYGPVSEPCASSFDALHASLIVPLIYQDRLLGSLSLGEKKSGKFYNREDIDLLHTLASQGSMAIENARLFNENLEKQRMEEELSIARDLQMSMLPSSCPDIKGFQFAARSVPAREVGGDFYDFIEMGEKLAGLVIGDVTGKSVSGALVVSASRSVFRMLSEERSSVGEIMVRANRRIKKDIKGGMFVALLYAVFNTEDKSLSICSAGQTHPVYLKAKTGQARLVETKGDTFPLGILEDVNYEETRLHLEPGDKVIFYTDGIVEAMNEQEEMFGFERLQNVVQAAAAMNADSLLNEILGRVAEFTGKADQHDDLTVIVVNASE